MPLPIYGQDNTGTFLLMVAMTLLMTLPHFRKSRESNTGSTSFSLFLKKVQLSIANLFIKAQSTIYTHIGNEFQLNISLAFAKKSFDVSDGIE